MDYRKLIDMNSYQTKRKKIKGKKLNRLIRKYHRGYMNIGCLYMCPYTNLLKFRELNVEY